MSFRDTMEDFFGVFRKNIIGRQQTFESPFGKREILYADWTASGRAYGPIEACLQNHVMPFLGNTHTETTITGTLMSKAYDEAKAICKEHVHAGSGEALIFCGSGMTSAVNKLQRILGWRVPERVSEYCSTTLEVEETLRPVVFMTHMEHHSHQVSWLETIATVEIINADEKGNVDLADFRRLLDLFRHRKYKVAAVTACSNVTGIPTPYHDIAKIIHEYGGWCFVDFAASAPYVKIDMHPKEKGAHLDAIYFSPHKFLGGPGTPGILIFHKKIYKNAIPDHPGGGTVLYSNPWKGRAYVENIEQREDGGTPPFLGGIKTAMCIRLKEKMGVENILTREKEMLTLLFKRFSDIKNAEVLEGDITERLGIISFIIQGAHYNLIVKILNDRFGIQTRGGCSCAGTYGHHLFHIDKMKSLQVWQAVREGDLSCKPGWVRLSIHPTMTNEDISFIMDAIEQTALYYTQWMKDYVYDPSSNEYTFSGPGAGSGPKEQTRIDAWFKA